MNCIKFIFKAFTLVSGLTLGFGTLFLGLAGYYKASEIYEVVEGFKDLNKTLCVLKDISEKNNTILQSIYSQNEILSIKLANNYKQVTPESKVNLEGFLKSLLLKRSLKAHSFLEGSSAEKVEQNSEINQIIGNWESIKTDEERNLYLQGVFEKHLNKNKY